MENLEAGSTDQCLTFVGSCYWRQMWEQLNCMRQLWQLCDVTLYSDDNSMFMAHSAVLAASSAVFHSYFVGQRVPDGVTVIGERKLSLRGISGDVLQVALDFIYGITPPTIGDVEKLKVAATMLVIHGAFSYCGQTSHDFTNRGRSVIVYPRIEQPTCPVITDRCPKGNGDRLENGDKMVTSDLGMTSTRDFTEMAVDSTTLTEANTSSVLNLQTSSSNNNKLVKDLQNADSERNVLSKNASESSTLDMAMVKRDSQVMSNDDDDGDDRLIIDCSGQSPGYYDPDKQMTPWQDDSWTKLKLKDATEDSMVQNTASPTTEKNHPIIPELSFDDLNLLPLCPHLSKISVSQHLSNSDLDTSTSFTDSHESGKNNGELVSKFDKKKDAGSDADKRLGPDILDVSKFTGHANTNVHSQTVKIVNVSSGDVSGDLQQGNIGAPPFSNHQEIPSTENNNRAECKSQNVSNCTLPADIPPRIPPDPGPHCSHDPLLRVEDSPMLNAAPNHHVLHATQTDSDDSCASSDSITDSKYSSSFMVRNIIDDFAPRRTECEANASFQGKESPHIELQMNEQKMFVCATAGCGYSNKHADYLRSHMFHRHGQGQPTHHCPHCTKAYFSAGQLNNHEKRSHRRGKRMPETGPMWCPDCREAFDSAYKLQTHLLKAHGKGKLFSCDVCQFKSPRKKDVQAHMLSQHGRAPPGVRVYSCPYCDYKCIDRNRYEEHEAMHTGIPKFTCPLCGKAYTTRRGMRTHVKYHSEDRPHRCETCDATFKVRSKLKDHVKLVHTHAGLKPYQCAYCDHSTALRGNCNQHIKKYHPGLPVRVIDHLAANRKSVKDYDYAGLRGAGIHECKDVRAASWASIGNSANFCPPPRNHGNATPPMTFPSPSGVAESGGNGLYQQRE